MMHTSRLVTVALWGLLLILPATVRANTEPEVPTIPKGAKLGIDYVVELTEAKGGVFDPSQVAELLDFVDLDTSSMEGLSPGRRGGLEGGCYRAEIKAPLSKVLKYAYNPSIPFYFLSPSSVRICGWKEGRDLLFGGKPAWDALARMEAPVMARGVEYEEGTPDSNTGAYFRYDLNRLLVLFKHNGRNVFISVSKQVAPSTVGKKGVILDEANWDYFYSGVNGLTKAGLTWMDAYVYDSTSVQVFYEPEPGQPRTVNAVFKWCKGGWIKLNVIKREHVTGGLKRYMSVFKQILEHDRLPAPEQVAAKVREIESLGEVKVKSLVSGYAKALEARPNLNPAMQNTDIAQIVKDGRYPEVQDREEAVSLLVKDYLRCRLGKPSYFDPGLCSSQVAQAGIGAEAPKAAD